MHIYPDTDADTLAEITQTLYLHTSNVETGVMNGYQISEHGTGVNTLGGGGGAGILLCMVHKILIITLNSDVSKYLKEPFLQFYNLISPMVVFH